MWRWHNVSADLESMSSVWPDLMLNVLQWITTEEDDRPVRVNPARDMFDGSEPVQFSGQVYDESLNPVDGAAVDLEVVAGDGTRFDYTLEPIGNGRYMKDLGSLPEGSYSYSATATRDGATVGSDRGEFGVGALGIEYRETRADIALMGQIARRSGGHRVELASVEGLFQRLSDDGQLSESIVQTERDEDLRHWFVFLALIVFLLTTEWILRKRSGMV
jgi:hypothetical protein